MRFEERADRWPSSWDMYVRFGDTDTALVEVRNVSRTGLKCAATRDAGAGERVTLQVMQRVVSGRVVDRRGNGFAIAFDRPLSDAQLNCLRQFRRLPRPAPEPQPR